MSEPIKEMPNEQEIEQYCREAADIANFLKEPDSNFVTVKPGDGWKINIKTGEIFFPPEDLSKDRDKRIFGLAHEIGHLLYDTPESFQLIKEHPEASQYKQEAADLFNVVRDIAINEKLSERFVGFRSRVTKLYQEEFFPKSFFTKENQTKVPPAYQFLNTLIFQHYNKGEIPSFTDDEAKKAIEEVVGTKKLKMAIKAYTPILSYKRILDEIWPVFFKLIKDKPMPEEAYPKPPGAPGGPSGSDGDPKPDQPTKQEKKTEGQGKQEKEKRKVWKKGMKVKDKKTGKKGKIAEIYEDGSVSVSFEETEDETPELKVVWKQFSLAKIYKEPDKELVPIKDDGGQEKGDGSSGEDSGGEDGGEGEGEDQGEEDEPKEGDGGKGQEREKKMERVRVQVVKKAETRVKTVIKEVVRELDKTNQKKIKTENQKKEGEKVKKEKTKNHKKDNLAQVEVVVEVVIMISP